MRRSVLLISLLLPALFLTPLLLVVGLFIWQYTNTKGLAYFGRPAAERERFRQKLARRGRIVTPVLRLMGPALRDPNRFTLTYQGVRAPSNNCNPKRFAAAVHYRPRANDVFVVTQMKCGTTWMQQLVYEVLMGGEGDLSDGGHGHLYAMSPWIESFNGVSMAGAPLVGAKQKRIIKTHLPARLCPYDAQAKYIYVTRHPVSCYRSCVDFFEAAAGPFMPDRAVLLEWFCGDNMWWGSWPDHVAGFWQWAETRANVCFFHFEELKADLPGVVRRVAAYLEIELTEAALERVAEKCSFDYMKAHEAQFEMMPPSFFSAGSTFFKRGTLHHGEPVTAAERARIAVFCRERLRAQGYPLEQFYPDILESSR